MTSEVTKAILVRHIVADALRNGKQEIEVISNPPTGSQSSQFTGGMAVDRMLSRTGTGMERGPSVEVHLAVIFKLEIVVIMQNLRTTNS